VHVVLGFVENFSLLRPSTTEYGTERGYMDEGVVVHCSRRRKELHVILSAGDHSGNQKKSLLSHTSLFPMLHQLPPQWRQ
jgi:hypothetical protein